MEPGSTAWKIGLLAGAIAVGLVMHVIVFALVRRALRRAEREPLIGELRRLRAPSLIVLPLLAVQGVLPQVMSGVEGVETVRHGVSLVLILGITWVLIALVAGVDDVILSNYDVSKEDNLEARRVHTQTRVLSRTIQIIIGVVGVGIALMTFPRVREFGVSMLASAGIAGIVIGMAARPTLANLIAGLQIALTQPIRLDDVVIVDGEWGRIEEITATYVVVRIWDERRLVVPLSRFIEQSFQNWTRTSAQLLGTAVIFTDYTVPVDALRGELERICKDSSLWDKRVCKIQVTDTTERTMQVRALVSAADSGKLWDLRCLVREELVEFIQREHPGALPVQREIRTNSEG